jgi:hypothetical protein
MKLFGTEAKWHPVSIKDMATQCPSRNGASRPSSKEAKAEIG